MRRQWGRRRSPDRRRPPDLPGDLVRGRHPDPPRAAGARARGGAGSARRAGTGAPGDQGSADRDPLPSRRNPHRRGRHGLHRRRAAHREPRRQRPPHDEGGDRLTRLLFERRPRAGHRPHGAPPGGRRRGARRRAFGVRHRHPGGLSGPGPVLIHANREGELALVARSAMSGPVPSPVPAAVHVQELLLPGAERVIPPAKAIPRVVQIFRAGSEEHVSFPESGLPGEVRRTQPYPVPPSPAPSPPPEQLP